MEFNATSHVKIRPTSITLGSNLIRIYEFLCVYYLRSCDYLYAWAKQYDGHVEWTAGWLPKDPAVSCRSLCRIPIGDRTVRLFEFRPRQFFAQSQVLVEFCSARAT